MATLPIDLIAAEIFPKLPARSLMRFKCVCKSYRTLISSREIVDAHLRHSLSSDTNRRLILIQDSDNLLYSVEIDTPNSAVLRLPIPQCVKDCYSFVLGSCNGLVCFLVVNKSYFNYSLFNPSTGVCTETRFDDPDTITWGAFISFGFGFDCKNDDYKLGRYVDYYKGGSYKNGREPVSRQVVVYSAKTDFVKKLEILDPKDSMVLHHMALIDDKLLNCVFWSSSKNKYRCGCFNICDVKWGEDVPLPDYNRGRKEKLNDVVEIGVFDGCLCLLTTNKLRSTTDVWIMKEYGVKESWIKFLGVSDSVVTRSLNAVPIAYGEGSKDEILLLEDHTSELVWYNLMSKRTKRTGICGVKEAFMCKDTLVSLTVITSARDQRVTSDV